MLNYPTCRRRGGGRIAPSLVLFSVALLQILAFQQEKVLLPARAFVFDGVVSSPSNTKCKIRPAAGGTENRRRRKAIRQRADHRCQTTIPLLMASCAPQQEENEEGSVAGAALLFAGTAIGAGMLALPAETAAAGFGPSIASLVFCWTFTVVTSLVTLEASWLARRQMTADAADESGGGANAGGVDPEAGFLSVSKLALGTAGEIVTGLFFWFLLTSIIVAYTSEGGILLSQAVQELSSSSSPNIAATISPTIGSSIFMAFFAAIAVFGTEKVDLVNRFLVAGLMGSFVGLVGVLLPGISSENLSQNDWTAVYPQVVSIGILSFGAQNVIPTLLTYLGGNPVRTRTSVIIGSVIPLLMYSLWEAVFLGVIPFDSGEQVDAGSKMQIVDALGQVGGVIVKDLVEIFSACSIGSSMAGASVSLVDFFQDAIMTTATNTQSLSSGVTGADETLLSSAVNTKNFSPTSKSSTTRRLLAAALALAPPLGVAFAFPGAFLGALENAGLIGGVTLYGIIPALGVLNLRRQRDVNSSTSCQTSKEKSDSGGGRTTLDELPGGSLSLYAIIAISLSLILPDLVSLASNVFF